jgi:hypothetical protein
MELFSFLVWMEVPTIFSAVADFFPKSVALDLLHYAVYFKYKVLNVYLLVPPPMLYWGWKLLLLLNLYVFVHMTSHRFRSKLQGPTYIKWNNTAISFVYVCDHVAFLCAENLEGPWSLASFSANTILALSANLYYSNVDDERGKYNYIFYTLAIHGVMVVRVIEALSGNTALPFLACTSGYIHTMLFARQLYYYYWVEARHCSYVTVLAASVDIALITTTNHSFDFVVVSDALLQLCLACMMEWLECFGDLTPLAVQLLLAVNTYTVSLLCNGPL